MDQSDAELVIQDGGAQVKTSHDRKRPTQTSDFHGDTIVKKHVILVTQERDYLLAQFCDYENKLYFIQPLLLFKFRSLNCDHKKLLLNFINCKIIFHWFFIVEVNFLSRLIVIKKPRFFTVHHQTGMFSLGCWITHPWQGFICKYGRNCDINITVAWSPFR